LNQERFSQLEEVIAKGRRNFHEIGSALARIRDEKLYRIALFENFEQYVRQRWEMGGSQAYRLIEASAVMDNLSPIGETMPQNESQARALTGLSRDRQRRIWREFLRSGIELTASNIRKFIAQTNRSKSHDQNKDLAAVITADYKAAALAMLEQIRMAKNDNWLKTSRQAALLWNRTMKEEIISKK